MVSTLKHHATHQSGMAQHDASVAGGWTAPAGRQCPALETGLHQAVPIHLRQRVHCSSAGQTLEVKPHLESVVVAVDLRALDRVLRELGLSAKRRGFLGERAEARRTVGSFRSTACASMGGFKADERGPRRRVRRARPAVSAPRTASPVRTGLWSRAAGRGRVLDVFGVGVCRLTACAGA
jgi:hypothetical protein